MAGNHDACLYGAVIDGLDSNCHYLCNNSVEIDGVDVLITHAPPYGILDRDGSIHYGSNELLSRVTAVRPRIHLFGHIHKANGLEESGGTVFSNAAIMNEHYDMLLEPHLIKL